MGENDGDKRGVRKMKAALVFLAAGLAAGGCAGRSPDAGTPPIPELRLEATAAGELVCSLEREGTAVLGPSPLGIAVAGSVLGAGVREVRLLREGPWEVSFLWRGKRSWIDLRGREAEYLIEEADGEWKVQVRTAPGGAAWRYLVPGAGVRRVEGERTGFVFPEGAAGWAMFSTPVYEGVFRRLPLDGGGAPGPGARLGLPLTFQLADGSFGSVLESGVLGYSGMTLRFDPGERAWTAAFEEETGGWLMEGEISSPWRVVLTGPDLDSLVGSGLVPALAPAPDPGLFSGGALTPWCRPGLSCWSWWADETGALDWSRQFGYVDLTARLGVPYYLIDSGWEDPGNGWLDAAGAPWEKLGELCAYARERGVGIWVWRSRSADPGRHRPGLETPAARADFFARLAQAGAAGAKVDFLNSESHARLEEYRDLLRAAAEHRIMLDFHGAAKPAGESRTWPNEMTREALRGLEFNRWRPLQPSHYSQLLFTRYLAGPGDFTPVTFRPGRRGATTDAFQLATGVLATSPFLCLADTPRSYLDSPARPFLETLPASWDETRVWPGSAVGGTAGFYRRDGRTWWIGLINPGGPRKVRVGLEFLRAESYRALIAEDDGRGGLSVRETAVGARMPLEFDLAAGGGAAVRLTPARRNPRGPR